MIALISGKLVEKRPEQVVVMAGGVGYRVFVSLFTFYELPVLGSETTLFIHTIVREDAFNLYGFINEEERLTFTKLISVSGVGPKVALGMLSGINPLELWQSVRARDTERLTKIPGIGKKTAARLVVELEGKLPQAEALGEVQHMGSSVEADALSALMNLGYPEASAKKAISQAGADLGEEPDLQKLLKASLLKLGGAK